ncbi:MAG: DUF3175 domain-containing protein, partial [Gammaproteobacteria bacterium]|nr:DUF3175 domain-containing protein [Gammaproteobacteria bacterium]
MLVWVQPPMAARRQPHRWSARVLAQSDALDLEDGVFRKRTARAVAASLRRSALASRRRKAQP